MIVPGLGGSLVDKIREAARSAELIHEDGRRTAEQLTGEQPAPAAEPATEQVEDAE